MNAYLSLVYRVVTCAAAAAVITVIIGMSFVESTSTPPGTHAPAAVVRHSLHA